MSEIKRAIIPATGHGTRLRPLTYGVPKELLLVNNKPMIHYCVLECIEARVEDIIIITNPKKHGIREYLENTFSDEIKFKYIIQEEPSGIVDAVLMAERYLEKDPFYILFPDVIYQGKRNPLIELAKCYEKYQSPVVALISSEGSEAQIGSNYGFIEYDINNDDYFRINELHGKGSKKRSVYKMTGRAIWDTNVLSYLNIYRLKDDLGEYSEVPALQEFVNEQEYFGVRLKGTVYDCGSLEGLTLANQNFSEKTIEAFQEKSNIDLSVVIPVFNEEAILNDLYQSLSETLVKITSRYEVLFVDDGSWDNSAQIIEALSKSDKRIKGIKFARNFGQHAALSAGLRRCKGKVIVTMDADLQNPPEEIPKLLHKLSEGYDLVWGRFEKRKHSFFRRAGSIFSKYILSKILGSSEINISTFRAIDARLVKRLNNLDEQNRFLDGLMIWLGAKTEIINVKHNPRMKGETKYNLKKLIRMWSDMVTSFSDFPLKLATIVGIVFSGIALFLSCFYLFMKILFNFTVPGFASIIIAIMLFAGIQLFCLGIIGEYIARIFIESKNRPFYVVDEEFGFSDDGTPESINNK
jgi:UTP-glucose-1-phosphate uridylyltransferase/glycosyltransferase involved in cell wall biosynthesis